MDIPFACQDDAGGGGAHDLLKKRVTQCALSRICGVCGESLDRPVHFVGSPTELGRNEFHFPPMHLRCVDVLIAAYDGVPLPGQDEVPSEWVVVTTSGFEFVRAQSWEFDRRPRFSPNSVIGERQVPAEAR